MGADAAASTGPIEDRGGQSIAEAGVLVSVCVYGFFPYPLSIFPFEFQPCI